VIKAAVTFATLLVQGNYSQAGSSFDATMAQAVPVPALRQIWESVQTTNGGFRRLLVESGREEKAGAFTISYVPAEFGRATLDLKIVTNAQGKVSGFFIVPHTTEAAKAKYSTPEYVNPGEFKEKRTLIPSSGLNLDALWTIPNGSEKFPAVILVHGSGPQDKDETIGPNKPFKDLAEGLASRGVAVLRYEKRTKQFPKSIDAATVTVKEETIDDAIAAVKLARETPEIDSARVFVLGHSLGGMMIPRIAQGAPDAFGFVILAANARPLEDLLVQQTEYLTREAPASMRAAELAKLKQQVALVKSEKLSRETAASGLPFGIPAAYWLDLRGYDPVAIASSIERPMLILQGGRDYQVTAKEDFSKWQQAFSNSASTKLKLYPSLNHLFASGSGTATVSEYMNEAKNVDSVVVEDIANWIKGQR